MSSGSISIPAAGGVAAEQGSGRLDHGRAFATQAVDTGAGVRFASTEEVYPGDQISEVFFGEKFATQRKDVALRFMKAYIRALRAYNDVLASAASPPRRRARPSPS